jgi:hypothetical protein
MGVCTLSSSESKGTPSLAITALSLQVLLFYGKGPAAVKPVYDGASLESGEFLQALVVESRHAFWISFILSE